MSERDGRQPRVLLFSEVEIGGTNATGQTLECLYEGYDSSLITQYVRPTRQDAGVGRRIAWTGWATPLLALHMKLAYILRKLTGPPKAAPVITHNAIQVRKPSLWSRLNLNFAAFVDLGPVRIPRPVLRGIREGSPEVVHAVVHSAMTMRLALALGRKLRIPVVPHFTDDWISTIFSHNELFGLARWSTDRLLKRLLRRSPSLLVIGDAMAQEYERRYDRPCFVAAYGVRTQDYEHAPVPQRHPRSLVYVGGGYIGRAALIDEVADELAGHGWEVQVHTQENTAWQPRSGNVRMLGELDLSELPQALCRADALLFVESLQPEVAQYTRLSVSTKVPQVIAAGRPIIAVGPEGQGSIEELRTHAFSTYIVHSLSEQGQSGQLLRYLSAIPSDTTAPAVPSRFRADWMQANLVEAFKTAVA